MNIEYTKNPSPGDIDFLTKQINQETSEYGEAYPFAFFMRSAYANWRLCAYISNKRIGVD